MGTERGQIHHDGHDVVVINIIIKGADYVGGIFVILFMINTTIIMMTNMMIMMIIWKARGGSKAADLVGGTRMGTSCHLAYLLHIFTIAIIIIIVMIIIVMIIIVIVIIAVVIIIIMMLAFPTIVV